MSQYFLPRDGGFIAAVIVRAICPFDRAARDSRDSLQNRDHEMQPMVHKKGKKIFVPHGLCKSVLSCYTIPLSVHHGTMATSYRIVLAIIRKYHNVVLSAYITRICRGP